MELILSAILIGFLLSTILIGPVFFLLIETSIRKSWKSAVTLDLGVIVADILCIAVAYFGSKDFADYITSHPKFYRIYLVAGFFVFIYGAFMFFSKPKLHLENEDKFVTNNYLKTFFNGFLMNLLNIGVIVGLMAITAGGIAWFVIVVVGLIGWYISYKAFVAASYDAAASVKWAGLWPEVEE